MKVVLAAINAKYIHSNLAVYSLRKYAECYKDNIEIAEYTINNYVDEILIDLYKKKPDVLAISCYIWNIDIVWEITREIKKVLPDVKIWLGGPEVSYQVEELFSSHTEIEGVLMGEGEETFLELMAYYIEGKGNLDSIKGLAYQKMGKMQINPPRPPMDLSDVPFPYDDLDLFEHKIIYYETSRGCPFSCSYCLSSIEKGIRLRSLDLVKRELQIFLDHKVPQVKFIDRTFNCNHNHAMAIWKYIMEHDNGVTNFHFEISADLLKEEELNLLNQMRVGLVQLEIGVQSTNPETIKAINRKMDLEKLAYAVKRIQEGKNIHQHLDLIAGLPFEDYASFQKSFNDVYALAPNQLQLGFLKVLNGAPIYRQQKEHDILYKGHAPYEVLATRWLPYDDVLKLKKVEDMVEIYYNSDQFANSLQFLLHYYKTPFDFYKELGDYYEKHQINGQKHARINRYRILLEFVMAEKPELREPLSELLVYDLYLRENLKSRPEFAKNQEQWKNKYHTFYKNMEEKNKAGEVCLLSGYEGYQARQMARMTHIEYFSYDIELLVNKGRKQKKDFHILFDYQKRNPLTGEARTIFLVEEDGKEMGVYDKKKNFKERTGAYS